MLKQVIYSLVLLLASTNLSAAIDLAVVNGWSTVLIGNNFDPGDDQQANSIDLRGDIDHPMFYMEYDDGGTPGAANSSDDEVAFRFRGDEVLKSGNVDGYLWTGLDLDHDGRLDVFMVLHGIATGGGAGTASLTIYNAGSDDNDSPSTTDIDAGSAIDLSSTYTPDTLPLATGFTFVHAVPADSTDVGADGDADTLVSYKIKFDALAYALNQQTLSTLTAPDNGVSLLDSGAGVTVDTAFRIVASSASQVNSLNGDIGGYGSGQTGTYESNNAFSAAITYTNLDPADPSATLIDVSPASVPADGLTASTITVQAKDSAGANLTASAGALVLNLTGSASLDSFTDNLDGTYTATITNTVVETVTVSGTIAGSAITDTAEVSFTDITPPAVSIIDVPASVNSTAFDVTVEFSEDVNDFISTDVLLANASVTGFTVVDGNTYTVQITPSGAGDVTIDVTADVAQDDAGNNNTAAMQVSVLLDVTAPTVDIQGEPQFVNSVAPFNVTVEFSEDVTGFVSADVLVANGSVTGFTPVDADTYTVEIAPSGTGNVSIDVATGAAQDYAGNNSTAAATAATFYDIVPPGVTIQGAPSVVNSAAAFNVTVQFSEHVSGFISGDIVVGNGSVTGFTAVDARTYSVLITPSGTAGNITVDVAANVAQDSAANNNTAAIQASVLFDDVAPIVNIASAGVANAANSANYAIGGDCTSGDGDVSINIAGATPASQDVNCTAAGSWIATFDVSAIADGENVLTINASQTDAATNTGSAIPVQVDKDVQISVPTINPLATSNPSPVISGTADSNTTITVVIAGATYTTTATAGGSWSVDTSSIADSGSLNLVAGSNEVVVTSMDAAGNSASDSSNNEITLSLDDDNDGVPNAVECPAGPPYGAGCKDSDGDGTPDYLDTDSDNDGIPDASEAGQNGNNPVDSDGDGIPDYLDTDSDNDGIDDVIESVDDTDGDGIPDYVDVGSGGDSDGDGIPDSVECPSYPGCADTDGDGQPDYLDTDADADGIDDAAEAGLDPAAPLDTDADGIPDYQDTDSDGDGVVDATELLNDADSDGIPDYVDAFTAGPGAGDSDGDGIADNIECELYPLCVDSDADGTPDYMETDSDDDGIADAVETGTANNDSDNDGIDDVMDVDLSGGLDLNGDGIDDALPLDSDGDGIPDYQDADSDGDGIDDIVEGVIDSDADGIPDYQDAANGDASGTDINGSGDSDGDGISDANECLGGVPCPDTDRDGLPDYMDAAATDGPAADFDNDALPNYLDPDDDNDNIPDVVEDPDFDADNNPASNPLDSDLDGIPDYLDSDSDNDGFTDIAESGASGNDSDNDNIDDSYDIDVSGGIDSNADGIDDNVAPLDSDGDSLPDYLDTVFDGDRAAADTDNDGISDEVECPVFPTDCPDTDGDGTPDFLESDADGDGLDDSDETGSLASGMLLDSDADGKPDYQDTDSDNDGISDAVEGLLTDSDADGIPDAVDADSSGSRYGGDSDGDGVEDSAECNSYPVCADTDNDGTPDYMDADNRPYDPQASINTALNGVGANAPWSLLVVAMMLALRRKAAHKVIQEVGR